jgi:hypothetical protein
MIPDSRVWWLRVVAARGRGATVYAMGDGAPPAETVRTRKQLLAWAVPIGVF